MDDEQKRVEEMKAKLEEHEKGRAEEAKQFNPKELAATNRALFTKVHPSFGKIVYGKVTMGELDEINEKSGNARTLKTQMVLWYMLKKGCAELTLEDVQAYGFDEMAELIAFLTEGFYLQKPPT
jgi:hypothetical protein